MNFKKGDKVSFIDEDLDGEIKTVSEDVIIILDEDGFEREVSPSEIIMKSDFLQDTSIIAPKSEDSVNQERRKKKKNDHTEVYDLHFHEIYHTDRGLSNFDKLSMQLDYAQNKIEVAKKNRKNSIVFIHGKGAGVLKSELRSLIRKMDNCYYKDADWREFGEGATTVIIGSQ